jgi:hypothetical protein
VGLVIEIDYYDGGCIDYTDLQSIDFGAFGSESDIELFKWLKKEYKRITHYTHVRVLWSDDNQEDVHTMSQLRVINESR